MAKTILVLLLVSLSALVSSQYNYNEVIQKSLLFYEAQRTGRLPSSNRIPWRGDSFVNDRGQNGEDLSGGYFDAGDFVKFGFPFASAMTMLAWGMVDFKEGYMKSGEWQNAKDALRFTQHVQHVQVGDGRVDHAYWGRPEDWSDPNPRPALRATTSHPASEVAGEQAAAMAAAAQVFFNDGEDSYGGTLLWHARDLYTFATTYRGKYTDSFPEIAEYYNSYSGFGDEFLWSAAWLYRVTGESKYKQDYEQWWNEFGLSWRPSEASWDLKQAQAQVLLAKVDGSEKYVSAARSFCDWVVDQAPKTPRGLVFLSQWGSLRHASNAVHVCLQAAEAGINPSKYRDFAKQQIDYMLGNGGRSFVCGYGNNPPQSPHHGASSCPNRPASCDWNDFSRPGPNPQVLNGALVGGPDNQNEHYEDSRQNYVTNEVALDYNAGFQSSLAGLCKLHC